VRTLWHFKQFTTIAALLLATGAAIAESVPAPAIQGLFPSGNAAEVDAVIGPVPAPAVSEPSPSQSVEAVGEAAEPAPAIAAPELEQGEGAAEIEVVTEPEPAPVAPSLVPVAPESPPVEAAAQPEQKPAAAQEPAPVAPPPVPVAPEPPPVKAAAQPESKPAAIQEPAPTVQARAAVKPTQPKETSTFRMSIGAGGIFAANFGGGIVWTDTPVELLTMPYMGGGGYLFLDVVYAEIFVGYFTGGGKWESGNASDSIALPELPRSFVNVGLLAKLPIVAGSVTLFPLLGIDYDIPVAGELKPVSGLAGDVDFKADDLAALWVKFGLGLDVDLSSSVYLRISALYGLRTSNAYEDNIVKLLKNESGHDDAETNLGHGLSAKAGVGFKF